MFNILRIQHSFVLKMYVYNMNMYKRYVIKFIFVRKVQWKRVINLLMKALRKYRPLLDILKNVFKKPCTKSSIILATGLSPWTIFLHIRIIANNNNIPLEILQNIVQRLERKDRHLMEEMKL